MKAKKEKIALLSTLALAISAVGVASVTTVKADTPTFAMINGASVRIPTLENDAYVDGGIRFTALLPETVVENYESQGYEIVEAGTFIMPVWYYEENEPNAENCFGENAK